MDKESFSFDQSTLARPGFDPFEFYDNDDLKYIHMSLEQLQELADKAHVSLPPLDGDEFVFWGLESGKHSYILEDNFGIDHKLVESDGRFINAGIAVQTSREKHEILLLGTSGDLHDARGKSLLTLVRSREGVNIKIAQTEKTIRLLQSIYGDTFTISQHTVQM